MILLLTTWAILVILLILALAWYKSSGASATKTWFLIALLLAAVLCSALANNLASPWSEYMSLLVLAVGGLGGSVPAAYFVGLLKAPALQKNSEGQEVLGKLGPLTVKAEVKKSEPQAGADGGGRLIGVFERLAVTLCLMMGQVGVLAVVVAVKGLARYPEIKSGHLTAEKFIVGTFASLLWAAGCALVALNLR